MSKDIWLTSELTTYSLGLYVSPYISITIQIFFIAWD